MTATIILTAAIQGFLIALGLIFKTAKNKHSNIYLSILIVLFSLELLFSWGSLSGYNNSKGRIPFWLLDTYLVIPPALWLFFKHNSEINFKYSPKHFFYFFPAFLQIVISSVAYFSDGKYLFFAKSVPLLWRAFTDWLPLLLTLLVLVFQAIKTVEIYKQYNSNQALRSHSLKLIIIFVLFCILGIIWIAESIIHLDLRWFLELYSVVILFGLAFISFFNPSFFEIPKYFQNTKSDEFKNYDDEKEFARLNVLFTNDTIFTKPKLLLKDLSAEMNLPSKYVSYLINTYTSSNFNDFINGFRVKEVLRKIPIEKNKTLLGIAMDAGFNSKSTFNQAFKQHTGKSPSEYLK